MRGGRVKSPSARARGARLAALALFLAAVAAGGPSLAPAEDGTARVAAVLDGDSVRLASGEEVRYLGIDSPEVAREGMRAEPLAARAEALNRELVLGKRVSLRLGEERRDRYGRLLAYVFLRDGTFVNGVLVENGLAWVYSKRPNLAMRGRLVALQREAMKKKRGLWARPRPAPEPFYKSGKSSFIFHRPSCPTGRRAQGRVFEDRREAFWQGYSPCRTCRP